VEDLQRLRVALIEMDLIFVFGENRVEMHHIYQPRRLFLQNHD
jgi:hypothetical protein